MWTLRKAQSDGAERLFKLDSRMLPHSRMTRPAMSGRSMTEMLVTLAIIGVLSIGALNGFRYAMDKIKANQVLNDISLAMADLKMLEKVEPEQEIELNFQPESGLDMVGYVDESEKTYVAVAGISKGVCEILLEFKNTGNIGMIYQDDAKTELTECSDEQIMAFAQKGECLGNWTGENCDRWIIGNKCPNGTECPEGLICYGSGSCKSCSGTQTPYCQYYNTDGSCERASCCSGTLYCSSYNSDGGCKLEGCCSSSNTVKETEDGFDACCAENETPYCKFYNSNGSCLSAACCSGTVTTVDGKDVCSS